MGGQLLLSVKMKPTDRDPVKIMDDAELHLGGKNYADLQKRPDII